ncbi:MAG: hypothetical protein E6K25_11670 [Gammaproteobacteria bacterium]|nr:MAG: hypothetical protein E6K25_11670 [Gammaproteobacteria bacterium]
MRQTYHVFESEGYFFVLSFALSRARRGSGYFNLVDKAAVDYVHGRVGGTRGVTANQVLAAARRTKHIPTRLLALNVLYVLVALQWATITRAGEHRQRAPVARRSHRARGVRSGRVMQ